MSILGYLFAWANAPFSVALGTTVLFAMLQWSGVLSLLAGGGDHEGDADGHDVDGHDVDGHDVDGHDVDGHDADGHDADGHDADGHDADHDGDQDGERSLGHVLFAPLGLGRLPFSIIWQTYAVVFAATGLALNARFLQGGPPLVSLAWTLPAALVAGYATVALISRFFGPMLSSEGQEASSRADLVGQVGVVISSAVTPEFGEVRFRDKSGLDIRVVCKLADGLNSPKEHAKVVVVGYEAKTGELRVAPLEDPDPDDPGESSESEERGRSHKRA